MSLSSLLCSIAAAFFSGAIRVLLIRHGKNRPGFLIAAGSVLVLITVGLVVSAKYIEAIHFGFRPRVILIPILVFGRTSLVIPAPRLSVASALLLAGTLITSDLFLAVLSTLGRLMEWPERHFAKLGIDSRP